MKNPMKHVRLVLIIRENHILRILLRKGGCYYTSWKYIVAVST